MTLESRLDNGLEQLNLHLDQRARTRLLDYIALLHKWNKVYNLTAVREPQKMVTQHILDSLAILPYIAGQSVADVGSGAGLPGIPLAVVCPDRHFTLLESNHKKTAFLRQAAIELGLTNVTVECVRAEEWRPGAGFDTVVSRAFSDLAEFVKLAGHLCAPHGRMLAMKGLYPYEELALLPSPDLVQEVVPLDVPGLEAKRHLVILKAPAGAAA
jgi:16S rRNA (guanine527-N7)-methyltransferase